jgi:hypothetical protein
MKQLLFEMLPSTYLLNPSLQGGCRIGLDQIINPQSPNLAKRLLPTYLPFGKLKL